MLNKVIRVLSPRSAFVSKLDKLTHLIGLFSYLISFSPIVKFPGLSPAYVPFRAQQLVLRAVQKHREIHAFNFARKQLPRDSLCVGWTCPESVELHNLLLSLDDYKVKVRSKSFYCPEP